MVLVLKALVCPDEVEFICILLAEPGQYVDLYLALTGIGRVILQNFDSYHFVGALLPALDDLTEGSASKEFEHLILVAQRAKHFVLNKLIVSIGRGRALWGSSGGSSRRCSRLNMALGRLVGGRHGASNGFLLIKTQNYSHVRFDHILTFLVTKPIKNRLLVNR